MGQRIDLSNEAGFPVWMHADSLELEFGDGIETDPVATRRISDITAMLPEPVTDGPDPLYSIYMDVRIPDIAAAMEESGLAFGAVIDAPGVIGREFVHSQGHVHSAPAGTDVPYLEIYEFWYGTGQVYLQDVATPDVEATTLIDVVPGSKVVIPPGWVHVVINTGPDPLVFGAIYVADAELLYGDLRSLNGTAWRFLHNGELEANRSYRSHPDPVRLSAASMPPVKDVSSAPMIVTRKHDPNAYEYVARPHEFPELCDQLLHIFTENPG